MNIECIDTDLYTQAHHTSNSGDHGDYEYYMGTIHLHVLYKNFQKVDTAWGSVLDDTYGWRVETLDTQLSEKALFDHKLMKIGQNGVF